MINFIIHVLSFYFPVPLVQPHRPAMSTIDRIPPPRSAPLYLPINSRTFVNFAAIAPFSFLQRAIKPITICKTFRFAPSSSPFASCIHGKWSRFAVIRDFFKCLHLVGGTVSAGRNDVYLKFITAGSPSGTFTTTEFTETVARCRPFFASVFVCYSAKRNARRQIQRLVAAGEAEKRKMAMATVGYDGVVPSTSIYQPNGTAFITSFWNVFYTRMALVLLR